MTDYNFTDRDTYKAWVKNWKVTYAEKSVLIRQIKEAMKIAARGGEESKAGHLQAKREYLRGNQRNAIAARHAAKEQAQRQYLAALEAKLAA